MWSRLCWWIGVIPRCGVRGRGVSLARSPGIRACFVCSSVGGDLEPTMQRPAPPHAPLRVTQAGKLYAPGPIAATPQPGACARAMPQLPSPMQS